MSAATVASAELGERIGGLPRLRLAVLPTGVQELSRLAAAAGVDGFYVKRDDLTGVALGGNKSRAMEFILADALELGCDVLIAGGGAEQSNHAVQCVAGANKAGLDAVIVLQRRADARSGGNALLHELLGGRTVWIDSDPELRDRTSASGRMRALAERLRAEGRAPYVLESSLHPLSVVGYVNAALELHDQLPDRPLRVYIASEGAALGGLLLGARSMGLPWDIVGLDWRPHEPGTVGRLSATIAAAASKLGLANAVAEDEIVIHASGGPAYGVGRRESWEALAIAARLEGLILDPVYTAKGLAGALADLHDRPPADGEAVVFVHTGGVAATFAYDAELRRHVIAGRAT